MICLGIDTSTSACSACVYDTSTDKVLASISEEIGKGHAERLIDLIGETLAKSDITYKQLDRIITSTGPGSFTGARVCVSAARGFGVSLKVPVIGVPNFDAMLSLVSKESTSPLLAIMQAGRGQVYCQARLQSDLADANQPFICNIDDLFASNLFKTKDLTLCTVSKIEALDDVELPIIEITADLLVNEITRLGASFAPTDARPEPLYLRKPDAKPQEHFAVERAT